MMTKQGGFDHQNSNSHGAPRQCGGESSKGTLQGLRVTESKDHSLLLIEKIDCGFPILASNEVEEPFTQGLRAMTSAVEASEGQVRFALVSGPDLSQERRADYLEYFYAILQSLVDHSDSEQFLEAGGREAEQSVKRMAGSGSLAKATGRTAEILCPLKTLDDWRRAGWRRHLRFLDWTPPAGGVGEIPGSTGTPPRIGRRVRPSGR